MKQEYWQHDVSGDIYAVQMDDAGTVTGVHGPVYYGDALAEHLDILDYDETDAEWMAHEPTHVYDPSFR